MRTECRLGTQAAGSGHDPGSRGERGTPRLAEHQFETEVLKPLEQNGKERTEAEKQYIAKRIKDNSKKTGKPKDEVEKNIRRRTLGLIDDEDEDVPSAEKL